MIESLSVIAVPDGDAAALSACCIAGPRGETSGDRARNSQVSTPTKRER